MPMPKPMADETRETFMARCMKDPATHDITGDSAEQSQQMRVAACERMFTESKEAEPVDGDRVGMKAVTQADLGDASTGEVVAVVATLDTIDHDGEIIARDAIPDGMKVLMSDYNHSAIKGQMLGTGIPDAAPVGKGEIRIEGDKAVYHGAYFLETQRGREAYLTTKAMGPDARWSFAYGIEKTAKPSAELAAKGARRILAKLGSLPGNAGMEVSPVNMPGGVGTGTLSLKAVDARPTQSIAGADHPIEDFAYRPDEKLSSSWKLLISDADHVRNALARWDQTDMPDATEKAKARERLLAAAKKFGIDVGGKAAGDVVLDGRIGRVKRALGIR